MTQEDKSTLEEFIKAFYAKYGSLFPVSLEDLLNQIDYFNASGAWSWHCLAVTSDIANRKLKVGETNPTSIKFFLESGINPNGISGKDDIGRTFTLNLEITGSTRYTQRRTDQGRYACIHEYGRSIEDFFEKVEEKMDTLKKLIERDNLKFRYVCK